jgi:hypothetical protein
MTFFLRFKHWQLFVLLVCTYFAFQIAGTTTVILSQDKIEKVSEHNYFVFKTATVISTQEISNGVSELSKVMPSTNFTVKVSRTSPVVILFIFVLLGWLYAVGTNLNKKLPDNVKMNLTKFKWFFFLPVASMFLFYIFAYFVLFPSVSNGIEPHKGVYIVVIPLFIFSIFCLFYCIYFNAKSLKAVELQRPATIRDYVLEFFLFWLFLIGVWFIQPKINKIFNEA